MERIILEIKQSKKHGWVALIYRNGARRVPFIVARNYHEDRDEWYGVGSYFRHVADAAKCYEEIE